jgi:hypothetical protein
MDMVKLRYVGKTPVVVPLLAREDGIEPDTLVEFPGRIVTEPPQGEVWLDDAIHIETGNPPEVRAWPTSLWRNETVTARSGKKE